MIRLLRNALVAATALVAACGVAHGHPHVWITMTATVIYGPDGTVTAVRHAWTFDDMFSTMAVQGLETKTKGVYTREDLHPLALENVTALKEYEYFNFARVNGKKTAFSEPSDFYLERKDELLTLYFTLPLKTPVKAQNLDLQVFDPAYFIDFAFAEKDPVTLQGAPAQCKLTLTKPVDINAPQPGARLSQQPEMPPANPDNWGAQFASKILVKCP